MIKKAYEREWEKLGVFEVSNKLIDLAQKNKKCSTFLNAGRGNPNWINTLGRRAFARFLEFGMVESERTMQDGDLAGYIEGDKIESRFDQFFSQENRVDSFIREAMEYAEHTLSIDKKECILELSNGIAGNNYPVPSRCLVNVEKVLNAYLEETLYPQTGLAKTTKLFPVEGGTAAIVYIFDSLKHNRLLHEGDQIAINMPIFTPYIQIPRLTNFQLTEINVTSTKESKWEIAKEEMEKLLDPAIKAFFLVNPSNPGAHSLGSESLRQLKEIVDQRKDLIIITDDVYGTFVDRFQSVYGLAPYNTLLVYSFSKLFGCTGWRLGLIAANEHNVCNDLLEKLPEEEKCILDSDYSIVTTKTRQLPILDRICADSRSIGLYHTSGLSTPQQCLMALFSLTHLVCQKQEDMYFKSADAIVARRYHILCDALEIPEDNSPTNAKYYTIIDIYHIAEQKYGKSFRTYLEKNVEQIDFLVRLSKEKGLVLMAGMGFDAPAGTLRISQANLPDEDYRQIGIRILALLEEYYRKYSRS